MSERLISLKDLKFLGRFPNYQELLSIGFTELQDIGCLEDCFVVYFSHLKQGFGVEDQLFYLNNQKYLHSLTVEGIELIWKAYAPGN